MEISHGLLVALMFIGLISVGIVTLVGGLAEVVNRRSMFRADRLHTSWMLLVLLVHFRFFWHVLTILDRSTWVFSDFLYMMLGPILLNFSVVILMPSPDEEDPQDVRGHYFDVAPQFFLFMALVQFWLMGVDLLLGEGITTMTMVNIAAGVLFLFLARRAGPRAHELVTGVLGVLFVGAILLRALGVIG